MISPPWRMASSLAGSIFHARSGSDFFNPTITFSISTTGRTYRYPPRIIVLNSLAWPIFAHSAVASIE